MLNRLIHWLERHELPCAWKAHLGFDCPGCGIQSAAIELLKGNVWESIRLYPALLPMLFMLSFLGVHLLFKVPRGALILKFLFIFTVVILLTGYFIKLFN